MSDFPHTESDLRDDIALAIKDRDISRIGALKDYADGWLMVDDERASWRDLFDGILDLMADLECTLYRAK